MIFRNREEAAHLLAARLLKYQSQDVVVLALPRGGLPVGRAIAEQLGVPLDIRVVRKIGAPGNAEFAIGAVTARGELILNEQSLRQLSLPLGYLEQETRTQRSLAEKRESYFREVRPQLSLRGKIVILVDDGIATGMTMRAAIADVRAQQPQKLVIAAPVIAPDTLLALERLADEVVALETPDTFFAVGQFYEHFPQVSDEEARKVLLEIVS